MVLYTSTTLWKKTNCFTLSHPHCFSRSTTAVYLSPLQTLLAALFWISCIASSKYSSVPPHKEIWKISLLHNIQFAIMSLILKQATLLMIFKAFSLDVNCFKRLFSLWRRYSFHLRSFCMKIPKSFSVFIGLISSFGVLICVLISNTLCLCLVLMIRRCVLSSFNFNLLFPRYLAMILYLSFSFCWRVSGS